jgi:tetratricopeptide (TPR) repeat protein
MHEIATVEPMPPSRTRPDLPAAFDQVIGRALAKEKRLRYGSASELMNALRELEPSPAQSSEHKPEAHKTAPPTLKLLLAPVPPNWTKRWWIAGTAALLLAAAAAYYQWGPTKAHVPDPLAAQLYARGRQDLQEFTDHGFKQSIVDFTKAIEHDPEYAAAYAGLADAYSYQAIFEAAPPKEVMPLAQKNASLALEKDPQQAEAYTSLAIVALGYDWDYPRAEQRLRKALKISPRDPFIQHFLGHYYEVMGRWPEAIKQMRMALDLEKLSPMYGSDLGADLFVSGRAAEAVKQLRETVAMSQQDANARNVLALALESNGQSAESLEQAEHALKLPGMFFTAGSLAGVFCRLHRPERAREILNQLETAQKAGSYIAAFGLAEAQLALGDKEKGLMLLRKAVDERDFNLVFNAADPVFDAVREDPAFAALMNEMHLPRAAWHDVPRYLARYSK